VAHQLPIFDWWALALEFLLNFRERRTADGQHRRQILWEAATRGCSKPSTDECRPIGPFKFSMTDKKTTVILRWISIAVMVAGVAPLVIDHK
jgi:hypothetical protein